MRPNAVDVESVEEGGRVLWVRSCEVGRAGGRLKLAFGFNGRSVGLLAVRLSRVLHMFKLATIT